MCPANPDQTKNTLPDSQLHEKTRQVKHITNHILNFQSAGLKAVDGNTTCVTWHQALSIRLLTVLGFHMLPQDLRLALRLVCTRAANWLLALGLPIACCLVLLAGHSHTRLRARQCQNYGSTATVALTTQ